MRIDMEMLAEMEPWEWPAGARRAIKNVLEDAGAAVEERALAAELGGDLVVMDDEMAGLLVRIVKNAQEPAKVRERAAIALGPVLEECDIDGFDDEMSDTSIEEATFVEIQEALRVVYEDRSTPKGVRRRTLEAAVRAEDEWQDDAIREAYRSTDPEWKMTAVFCMRYVAGFEGQILEALKSKNEDIECEAVRTAASRGLEKAWPHVRRMLVEDGRGDRDILLTAIVAAGELCPGEEQEILEDYLESEDEEVAEAAQDALDTINTGARDVDGIWDDDEDEEEKEEDEEKEEEDLK